MADAAAVKYASTLTRDHGVIKEFTPSQVTGGYFLGLPAAFGKLFREAALQAEAASGEGGIHVLLQHGQRHWPVVYRLKGSGACFSGGWKGFVIDNTLQVHDAVVFERVTDNRIKVHVFRASQYRAGSAAVKHVAEPDAPEVVLARPYGKVLPAGAAAARKSGDVGDAGATVTLQGPGKGVKRAAADSKPGSSSKAAAATISPGRFLRGGSTGRADSVPRPSSSKQPRAGSATAPALASPSGREGAVSTSAASSGAKASARAFRSADKVGPSVASKSGVDKSRARSTATRSSSANGGLSGAAKSNSGKAGPSAAAKSSAERSGPSGAVKSRASAGELKRSAAAAVVAAAKQAVLKKAAAAAKPTELAAGAAPAAKRQRKAADPSKKKAAAAGTDADAAPAAKRQRKVVEPAKPPPQLLDAFLSNITYEALEGVCFSGCADILWRWTAEEGYLPLAVRGAPAKGNKR